MISAATERISQDAFKDALMHQTGGEFHALY